MRTQAASCVFRDIVAGSAPASVVCDDDHCLALLDIGPVNSGHLLIVQKSNASGLSELDVGTGAHLFRVAMRHRRTAVRGAV